MFCQNNNFDLKTYKLYDVQIKTFTNICKVKLTHIILPHTKKCEGKLQMQCNSRVFIKC
jgi:hypothetical protein